MWEMTVDAGTRPGCCVRSQCLQPFGIVFVSDRRGARRAARDASNFNPPPPPPQLGQPWEAARERRGRGVGARETGTIDFGGVRVGVFPAPSPFHLLPLLLSVLGAYF